MSSKNEQMKRLIETMVQKEVRRVLPQIVPHVIKEIFSGMIMESKISPPVVHSGNSSKRMALVEASGRSEDFEPYPEVDRNRMATLMGYEEYLPVTSKPFISEKVTEAGTPIPVDPNDPSVKIVNDAISRAAAVFKNVQDRTGR